MNKLKNLAYPINKSVCSSKRQSVTNSELGDSPRQPNPPEMPRISATLKTTTTKIAF